MARETQDDDSGAVSIGANASADVSFEQRANAAIDLLESIRDDRSQLVGLDQEQRKRLLMAAGQVARPGPVQRRRLAVAARRQKQLKVRDADERRLAESGIRKKRAEVFFTTPALVGRAPVKAGISIDDALATPAELMAPPRRVVEARNCYVCKRDYSELHHFYDSLCPACGELNWAKRQQTADLRGRVAVITGSRVKIGYQAAIMLLRAGARVVVTTRFPRDAATRYARESDYNDWCDRLEIYGLDLRHTPSVESFARHLNDTAERLDFLLNNACQTVRRPTGFYTHLMAGERQSYHELAATTRRTLAGHESLRAQDSVRSLRSSGWGSTLPEHAADSTAARATGSASASLADSAELSQVPLLAEDLVHDQQLFPAGQLDADLQQVDQRGRNSWRLALHEVSAVELLEVHLVNAVAPFVLNARLKGLMQRTRTGDQHIVNVSAVEGQFYRTQKTDKHPHTNMAKAALNMMTRTSAADYIRDGIHVNSVDTGWITDEDPTEIAARKREEHGFHPPLDIVDGAARICDPIFNGLNTGKHVWGMFLKDYTPTDW